jgi:predicted esterase
MASPNRSDESLRGNSGMARNTFPDPFIVAPKSEHTHTAILLHGLGSNGETFGRDLLRSGVSSSGQSLTDSFPGMRFIFPTARKRRSSAFKRATINQLFDIASLDDPSKRRELQIDGLTESAKDIWPILKQEADTIPPQNIILGGLSQGCAMALFVLLSLDFSVGCFIGLSGWLPFCKDILELISYDRPSSEKDEDEDPVFGEDSDKDGSDESPPIQAINLVRDILSMGKIDTKRSSHSPENLSLTTPVFLGHGKEDLKIKCSLGEEAVNVLKTLGMDVTWRCYSELGHWYKIPDEIDDVVEYLMRKLTIHKSNLEGVETCEQNLL